MNNSNLLKAAGSWMGLVITLEGKPLTRIYTAMQKEEHMVLLLAVTVMTMI